MNTTENNKLIAEFMGLIKSTVSDEYWTEKTTLSYGTVGTGQLANLAYDSDWNWLIPAIEKCRENQIFGSQRLIDNINKRLLKLDLLSTYKNVVDFIKWHNEQKNQK